jgi:hypothetical protein
MKPGDIDLATKRSASPLARKSLILATACGSLPASKQSVRPRDADKVPASIPEINGSLNLDRPSDACITETCHANRQKRRRSKTCTGGIHSSHSD